MPTALLLSNKSLRKHPDRAARRACEPRPELGLGPSPSYMDEAVKARWQELIEIVPAGVLTRMDGPSAELLCILWAEMRRGGMNASNRKTLMALFGKFGLTPAERSRVAVHDTS
jgi:hypothetical protein